MSTPLPRFGPREKAAGEIEERTAETSHLAPAALRVNVRIEDVAVAYREWYKEQVAKDKRDELGRFLFGVSSASLALLISLQGLLPKAAARQRHEWLLLGASALLLVLSSVCALYLAVPKNHQLPPEDIELVSLQREHAREMTRAAMLWFALWMMGIAAAGIEFAL